MSLNFGNIKYLAGSFDLKLTLNKPRYLLPSAAATLTSSHACAGRYAVKA
jgi:hypothetical protein